MSKIIEETVDAAKPDTDFKIDIEEARKLADEAQNGWRDIYQESEDDLEFYDAKNQWEEKDRNARIKAGRHALVVNRLPEFVHQVVNTTRQNTPNIKILPSDGGADIETAQVIEDLMRNIQYVSKANIAYDTALEYAVKCGIGFIRIDHDYTAPDSFEQEILIKRVPSPLAVVIDPNSIEADGSDATYGFIFDVIPEDKFKKMWPNAKPESFDTKYIAKNAPAFVTENKYVVVADLYKLHAAEEEIYQLDNGEVVCKDDYDKMPVKHKVVNKRTITKNKCMHYKMSGAEILKEVEFPSSYIPLIPVYGEEHWIKGKRHLYSLIRNAKDTQRYYNYLKSLEIEMIKKAPKAPYIAVEGQLSGYEDQWRNPDESNVLIYKNVNVNGQPAPMPSRVQPIMVQQGLVEAGQATIEDMKSTMGIYDPSLGQRQGQKSGRAIIAEQNQGDVATYHFPDNLSRSVTHVGVIIMDMLPQVYDTPRILRTMGEDSQPKNIAVAPGQSTEQFDPAVLEGIDNIYDITVGKYDVAVVTGKSYATKRLESQDSIMQLAQAIPQLGQVAPDVIAGTLDFPNVDELVKRLKKTVPPQFLDQDDTEEAPDLRPQLQQAEQMMHAASDHIEQLQQQLTQAQAEAQNDQQKNELAAQKNQLDAQKLQLQAQQLELDKYKLTIEEQQIQADREKTQVQGQVDQVKTLADLEKHKADTEANVKQAEISSPNYMPALENQGKSNEMISALGEAVVEIGQRLEAIGQAHQALHAEVTRPKKVVAKRDENNNLYAEVVH